MPLVERFLRTKGINLEPFKVRYLHVLRESVDGDAVAEKELHCVVGAGAEDIERPHLLCAGRYELAVIGDVVHGLFLKVNGGFEPVLIVIGAGWLNQIIAVHGVRIDADITAVDLVQRSERRIEADLIVG